MLRGFFWFLVSLVSHIPPPPISMKHQEERAMAENEESKKEKFSVAGAGRPRVGRGSARVGLCMGNCDMTDLFFKVDLSSLKNEGLDYGLCVLEGSWLNLVPLDCSRRLWARELSSRQGNRSIYSAFVLHSPLPTRLLHQDPLLTSLIPLPNRSCPSSFPTRSESDPPASPPLGATRSQCQKRQTPPTSTGRG